MLHIKSIDNNLDIETITDNNSLKIKMSKAFKLKNQKPIIKCMVFEDNNGALELSNDLKSIPRTKHIAIKHHHFRAHVANGSVKIEAIDTTQ